MVDTSEAIMPKFKVGDIVMYGPCKVPVVKVFMIHTPLHNTLFEVLELAFPHKNNQSTYEDSTITVLASEMEKL